jgi:hypothetical protein
MANNGTTRWPDMTVDNRAMELAKTALGWADMDAAAQMQNLSTLAARAQQFKVALQGGVDVALQATAQ